MVFQCSRAVPSAGAVPVAGGAWGWPARALQHKNEPGAGSFYQLFFDLKPNFPLIGGEEYG